MVIARYELVEGKPAVRRVPKELHALLRELVGPLDLVQRLLPLRDRHHQLLVNRRQHHRRLRYLEQKVLQVTHAVVADLESPDTTSTFHYGVQAASLIPPIPMEWKNFVKLPGSDLGEECRQVGDGDLLRGLRLEHPK